MKLSTLNRSLYRPVWITEYDGHQYAAECLLESQAAAFGERAEEAMAFEYLSLVCDLAFSRQQVPAFLRRAVGDRLKQLVEKELRYIV